MHLQSKPFKVSAALWRTQRDYIMIEGRWRFHF